MNCAIPREIGLTSQEFLKRNVKHSIYLWIESADFRNDFYKQISTLAINQATYYDDDNLICSTGAHRWIRPEHGCVYGVWNDKNLLWIQSRSEHSILLAGMRDTYSLMYICECELQYLHTLKYGHVRCLHAKLTKTNKDTDQHER
jgi:hypothetical protein